MFDCLTFDRNADFEKGEIILVDKPLYWTSFDVVNKLRFKLRIFTGNKKIKVGHAGTLDPLATGLLIVCTGKATKIIDQIQGGEKTYQATFRLGATTPSFDMETEINNTYDISDITEEKIKIALDSFLGESLQAPPIYSAIQINGKRAYEYARKGDAVEIKKREINISKMEITEISLPDVSVLISCSKGTYIRSLASNFGETLDNGAFLYYLRRVQSGIFNVENAINLEDFDEYLNKLKQLDLKI